MMDKERAGDDRRGETDLGCCDRRRECFLWRRGTCSSWGFHALWASTSRSRASSEASVGSSVLLVRERPLWIPSRFGVSPRSLALYVSCKTDSLRPLGGAARMQQPMQSRQGVHGRGSTAGGPRPPVPTSARAHQLAIIILLENESKTTGGPPRAARGLRDQPFAALLARFPAAVPQNPSTEQKNNAKEEGHFFFIHLFSSVPPAALLHGAQPCGHKTSHPHFIRPRASPVFVQHRQEIETRPEKSDTPTPSGPREQRKDSPDGSPRGMHPAAEALPARRVDDLSKKG